MGPNRDEVVLCTAAHNLITSYAQQYLPAEIGGILLGYREDRLLIITDALIVVNPVPTAANRYDRDDVQANRQLRGWLAARDRDDPVGYIGEWHSHPARGGSSALDIAAIPTQQVGGRRGHPYGAGWPRGLGPAFRRPGH